MQNAKYTATNYALRSPQNMTKYSCRSNCSNPPHATYTYTYLGSALEHGRVRVCSRRVAGAGSRLPPALHKAAKAVAASCSSFISSCVCICVCVTILHFMSNAHAFNIDRRWRSSSSSSQRQREETDADADATCSVWQAKEHEQGQGAGCCVGMSS